MQQEIKWPAEGNARVPYRMFSDPEIYHAELSRIFLGPTWQYLALAGQLPQPGDYLTTFLGENARHRYPRPRRRNPCDGQPLRPSRQSRLSEAARPCRQSDLRLSRLAL